MFITAVCVVIKLQWPKSKSLSLSFLQEKEKYDTVLGLQIGILAVCDTMRTIKVGCSPAGIFLFDMVSSMTIFLSLFLV